MKLDFWTKVTNEMHDGSVLDFEEVEIKAKVSNTKITSTHT